MPRYGCNPPPPTLLFSQPEVSLLFYETPKSRRHSQHRGYWSYRNIFSRRVSNLSDNTNSASRCLGSILGPCQEFVLFNRSSNSDCITGFHFASSNAAGRALYSYRSATFGSTRVANIAGKEHAASPTTATIATTAPSVAGSTADTPHTWLAISRARA